MRRLPPFHRLFPALLAMLCAPWPVAAAAPADFYRGKTVTLISSSDAAGTAAFYARTAGDFIGRYIPGKPTVVMQFMPGAGGIAGANHCYGRAARDGTELCHIQMGLPLLQLLDPRGVQFDARKFNYLGRTATAASGIYVWHTVPVRSLADVRGHEVVIGASGRGSETYMDPTIINGVLGTRFKVIVGYPGGGEIDFALERGEITGDAGPVLSVFVRKRHWVDNKQIRFLVQTGSTRDPRLPDVPLLSAFARNDEERGVFALLSARADIGYTLLAPPGVPPERVAVLRKAMADMLADPAFLMEARRRNIDIMPGSATQVEASVRRVFATPPAVVARVRQTLGIRAP